MEQEEEGPMVLPIGSAMWQEKWQLLWPFSGPV